MGPSRIPLETPGRLYVASLADMASGAASVTRDDVDTVVCLVEQEELNEYPQYAQWIATSDTAIHFPITDHGVASADEILAIGNKIATELKAGHSIVIHCHAGFGRSSLMVASALIPLGYVPQRAVELLRSVRPNAGPETRAQEAFIAELDTEA